jgi:pimeloyl-ACP methyl ester carboxylesterase
MHLHVRLGTLFESIIMKPSRSEFITVRGLRYHIRHWGREGAPLVFMVHGWMDVSASFQFVVDHFKQDWHVIAPDWRGFGLSDASKADTYWFPDYMADLEAILDHYAPDQAVDLVGHSMGGNVITTYAGVRPSRIARLIDLEGFGMPATKPEHAPGRYAKWLDELRSPPTMRTYASQAEVAARMQQNNLRLPAERAAYLSGHWARETAPGVWEIQGDPVHKATSAVLYRIDEIMACWQAITAPVLWVEGAESDVWRGMGPREQARAELDRRKGFLNRVTTAIIPNAGHMLHHDQPQALAQLIEDFLLLPDATEEPRNVPDTA